METSQQQLIISLIKDDLINTKLVEGLNEIGLNADNYYLNLSETIVKLMGYREEEQTEEILDLYMELSERARHTDISKSVKPMEELALQIYTELNSRKPAQ